MPKHTPATPLPWHVPSGQFDFGNDGSRRLMYGASSTDVYGRIGTIDSQIERKRGKNATPYNAPDEAREANAAYIAHAANAYPRLVATMRYLAAQAEDFSADHGKRGATQRNESFSQARVMAQDLLRELGEAE